MLYRHDQGVSMYKDDSERVPLDSGDTGYMRADPGEVPTIWIANEAGHEGYGKARLLSHLHDSAIYPLTRGNVNVFQVDRLLYTLSEGVVRHVKENDRLILSGSIVISLLACQLWVETHGRCHILQWMKSRSMYVESTISRDHIADMVEQRLQGV